MSYITSEHTQTTLLDFKGKILSSCNSLFDLDNRIGHPAYTLFPMLESIIETFQDNPRQEKIHLPRIETPLPELRGFYDFTFEVVKYKNRLILRWIIYDFTLVYKALQRKQQLHHNKELGKKD